MSKAIRNELITVAVIFAVIIVLSFIPAKGVVAVILHLIPYLAALYGVLRDLFKQLNKKRFFNEYTQVTILSVLAVVIGAFDEATEVLLLFRLGVALVLLTNQSAKKHLMRSIDKRQDSATVTVNGTRHTVSAKSLEAGSIYTVTQGEVIPLDAQVISGTAVVDASNITGGSEPYMVKVGDEVLAGSAVTEGEVRLMATRTWKQSIVSKIVYAVEHSSDRQTDIEKAIARVSRMTAPAVLVLALLVLGISLIIDVSHWHTAVYKAVTVTALSYPFALGFSQKTAFLSGVGKAAKCGILIRGSYISERLSKCSKAVLDMSSVLTEKRFSVVPANSEVINEEQLLELTALALTPSDTPEARTVKAHSKGTLGRENLTEARELEGLGCVAQIAGRMVAVGNARLMARLGITLPEELPDGDLYHVAAGQLYAGYVVITEAVKEDADRALYRLRSSGVRSIAMVTEDKMGNAARVAEQIPTVNEYYPSLTQSSKIAFVEKFVKDNPGDETVAYVGDGNKDAAVLAAADVGIAINTMTSESAMNASDVAIVDGKVEKLHLAKRISEATVLVIKENAVLILAAKVIVITLAIFGVVGLSLAVLLDALVAVAAVINSLRLLFKRKK